MTNNYNSIIENINNIIKIIDRININTIENMFNFEIIVNLIDNMLKLSNDIATINNENIDLEEFNDKLTKLLNTFEDKDYMLFNDTLQYELKPVLEFWKEKIN